MKKFILMLLATGACCALLAADFWQTKKFTEWDEKEVAKILKDSPWSRSFTVETGKSGGGGGKWRGGGSNPNRGMGGSGGAGGGGGRGGRGGGGGMGGGNMGNGGDMGGYGEIPVSVAAADGRVVQRDAALDERTARQAGLRPRTVRR